MKSGNISSDIRAIHRFFDSCQNDDDFYRLAYRDARAALASVGVQVPGGVSIRLAADAASALDLALSDRSALVRGGAELDDSQLLAVTGGAGKGGDEAALQAFLGLFRTRPS